VQLMAYDPGAWQTFYIMTGGAAAALTGPTKSPTTPMSLPGSGSSAPTWSGWHRRGS